MKFDLIAIGKLSPAGLWGLAELTALIATLLNIVNCSFSGVGWAANVRRSERMLAQCRHQLRARTLDNFNMRIKAWVMQCPERIAEVRQIIGEAAIKRWQRNRLLDYAFTETFGDWKSAFPNGLNSFRGGVAAPAKPQHKLRAYIWKPFALVKIDNAVRLLYGQSIAVPASHIEAHAKRAAYFKLWGVDIVDTEYEPKTTQPRQARAVKPVRFTPDELVPKAVIGATETPKQICGEAKIYLSPKPKQLLSEIDEPKLEYKPP